MQAYCKVAQRYKGAFGTTENMLDGIEIALTRFFSKKVILIANVAKPLYVN